MRAAHAAMNSAMGPNVPILLPILADKRQRTSQLSSGNRLICPALAALVSRALDVSALRVDRAHDWLELHHVTSVTIW